MNKCFIVLASFLALSRGVEDKFFCTDAITYACLPCPNDDCLGQDYWSTYKECMEHCPEPPTTAPPPTTPHPKVTTVNPATTRLAETSTSAAATTQPQSMTTSDDIEPTSTPAEAPSTTTDEDTDTTTVNFISSSTEGSSDATDADTTLTTTQEAPTIPSAGNINLLYHFVWFLFGIACANLFVNSSFL